MAWAIYTCVFSFWIGQALDGYPVLSIVTSMLITTALLALMYFPLKGRYEAAGDDQGPDDPSGEPSDPAGIEPRSN